MFKIIRMMTRAKKLNTIAEGIAEVTKELLHDSVDWQLGDYMQNGDDYEELHNYVVKMVIKKMYEESKNFKTYVDFD
jgi:hypothetical protein